MPDEPSTPSPRAQEVFFAALDLPEPAARVAFLDRACHGDQELRRWVDTELRRQLLLTQGAAPATQNPATDGPTVSLDAHDTTSSPEVEALLASLKPEEPGEVIGVYKLLELLGEGGFGTVWAAEQSQPVRRQVALKIIRVGMNSREVIARFAQERQALALMDHPNIAKVFDAGATPYGRPYFAMELVRGEPITEYCDTHRLPIARRLELFMQVCYALQHAHQKGIIHRDIKPTNVLVATQDDHPAPKVIDFGIAKATQQERLTEMTLVTRADFMLGTPLYMSPEQAESEGTDIDTRSDIYSLGVLLYVLLAGRTPLDPEVVNQSNFEDLLHLIRDEELPRPTAALRHLSVEELREVADRRDTEPARVVQAVRGDLEWICMKALEKDRRRRYAAAGDLAQDIQRYLLNEPIVARPPSQFYRLRKLASRNRQAVGATVAILFILMLATAVSLGEAFQARAAEARAVASMDSEAAQRLRAEKESTAARLSEYIANVGLTQQAINSGNLARASELLQKERPADGKEGLRDFAWRYLWRQAQGDEHDFFPDQDGPVSALAFSPDGQQLVVAGLTEVAVCDATTRRQVKTLRPGAGTLAFLPDGKTLITIGEGHLHLWNTEDWTEQASWPESNGPIALSPDGRHLAIVTHEGVRLRDTATWRETQFFPGAGSPLIFSPDSRTLATTGLAGITLRTLDGSTPASTLPDSANLSPAGGGTFLRAIQTLAFSPDGTTLTAPQNNLTERGVFLLRTWDVRTGQELTPMPANPEYPEHTGAITSVVFSPDGKTLATTSLDHSVRLWDPARRLSITALHGHRAEVGGCVFAPDGHTLVSCDRSGYLAAWAIPPLRDNDVLTGIRQPLGFSPDGKLVAAVDGVGQTVFYDTRTRETLRILPLVSRTSKRGPVALSADFKTLVQGLEGGDIAVMDIGSETTRTVHVAERPLAFLALRPGKNEIVYSLPGSPLRQRDLLTGAETVLPLSARRAVLSADGRLLAPVSTPRMVAVPRADNPFPQRPNPVSQSRPPLRPENDSTESTLQGFVADSPNQSTEMLTLWDLTTHAPRATLDVELRYVLDAAFSSDGRRLAAAMSDNTIHLWDTRTGAPLGIFSGHRQVVFAVAFSPEGKTLASASEDGTLRLWNVATQQELLSLSHLGEHVSTLSFSSDGRTLIASDGGLVHVGQIRFHRAPTFAETDWEMPLEKLK